MKRILLSLLLSAIPITALANEYKIREYDPITNYNSAFLELTLESKSDGEKKISEIFNTIIIDHENLAIRILGLSHETREEIKSFYEKTQPSELNNALKSSGNLHNPTLKPLIHEFHQALQSTELFQELEAVLKKYNYDVVKIEFEKFSIISRQIYVADIYIKCKKIASNTPSSEI